MVGCCQALVLGEVDLREREMREPRVTEEADTNETRAKLLQRLGDMKFLESLSGANNWMTKTGELRG